MKLWSFIYKVKKLFFFGIVILSLYTYPYLALAQLVQSDIAIETVPDVPEPYKSVTIKLVSYAIDLNNATITWIVNGSSALAGVGAKQFSLDAPGPGASKTVVAKIVFGSSSLSKQIIIKPSQVDLLWQAIDSTVPPFYRGKSLPGSEGIIKIVAMPVFSTSTQQSGVIYNWKKNFNSLQDASGYNKNSINIKLNYLNPIEQFSVVATNTTTGSVAKKTINLKPYTPKILFYEKDPLLGIKYEKTLENGFLIDSGEKTIVAEPFFFSPGNKLSRDLQYTWKINNSVIPVPETKNILTIKSGGVGVSDISLEIKNISKLFQASKEIIKINLK